jgi:hypothetical protein
MVPASEAFLVCEEMLVSQASEPELLNVRRDAPHFLGFQEPLVALHYRNKKREQKRQQPPCEVISSLLRLKAFDPCPRVYEDECRPESAANTT